MYNDVRFTLNGQPMVYTGNPLRRLLDVLREDYGLTGSKEGCGEGECGACSIIKNGKLVTPCIIPVGSIQGAELLTIEGIRDTEKGKCIIDAYAEGGAVQCGFCIPGMVMATYVLLNENPNPTEDEIRLGISGNLLQIKTEPLMKRQNVLRTSLLRIAVRGVCHRKRRKTERPNERGRSQGTYNLKRLSPRSHAVPVLPHSLSSLVCHYDKTPTFIRAC